MAYKMTAARRAALRKAQMASARARKLKRKVANSRVAKSRPNAKKVALTAAGLVTTAVAVKAGVAVYKNNKKYEQKVYRESAALIRAKKSPFTHRGGKTQKRKVINPVIRRVSRARRGAMPQKPMTVLRYTQETVFGRRR